MRPLSPSRIFTHTRSAGCLDPGRSLHPAPRNPSSEECKECVDRRRHMACLRDGDTKASSMLLGPPSLTSSQQATRQAPARASPTRPLTHWRRGLTAPGLLGLGPTLLTGLSPLPRFLEGCLRRGAVEGLLKRHTVTTVASDRRRTMRVSHRKTGRRAGGQTRHPKYSPPDPRSGGYRDVGPRICRKGRADLIKEKKRNKAGRGEETSSRNR